MHMCACGSRSTARAARLIDNRRDSVSTLVDFPQAPSVFQTLLET